MIFMHTRAILSSTRMNGNQDLLSLIDTDLNDNFTLALRTVTGMYFIII